jgi:CBS domain containing-hemolysin-like protein
MTDALALAAVAVLILANGWFVLVEFAYVAARRPQIAERAAAGDRRSQRALEILRRLSFMLSGAQLGITATSLLVGYVAEPLFRRLLGPVIALTGLPEATSAVIGVTLGLVLATGTQMIIGELTPKNLAIAKPEEFARALATPALVYLTVAGPVIRLFDGAANALLRALGIEPSEELRSALSAEELGLVIAESGRGGVLTGTQAALLARVLGFRSLRAADAMVPRTHLTALRQDANCEDLRHVAIATGHSRFPVIGEDLDDVLGVVQAKDVLGVPVGDRPTTRVADLMKPPVVAPESAQLGELLTDLRAANSTLAIVIDEHGGTAGLVTMEDIVEELVGQIRDEYDAEEPAVVPVAGGGFMVPGSWRPDEVARDTGLELPTGDYETVSGLMMERLGRVPATGDSVDVDGLVLEVAEMDGHAVGWVRLRVTRDAGEEGPAR